MFKIVGKFQVSIAKDNTLVYVRHQITEKETVYLVLEGLGEIVQLQYALEKAKEHLEKRTE